MTSNVELTPWLAGIADLHHSTRLPKGAVLDAVNGVFGQAGEFTTRGGRTLVTTGGHSLFEHSGRVYGVLTGTLGEYGETAFTPLYGPVSSVSWCLLNDAPVFTAHGVLGRIVNGVAEPIGVELPGAFSVVAGVGSLPAGMYHVALSYLSVTGEESGLSDPVKIDCSGGITVALPTPLEVNTQRIRVYCTQASGDVFHASTTVPVGTTMVQIDSLPTGEVAQTQFLKRMVGGEHVRYWNGRLVVAKHKTLYFSEPLRYGAYDPRTGFLRLPERITFIEALESGLYVGQGTHVLWLQGTSLKEMSIRVVSTVKPHFGGSVVVPGSCFNDKLAQALPKAVVWLTASGFALGSTSGEVLYPQGDLLGSVSVGQGRIVFRDNVLTALLQ